MGWRASPRVRVLAHASRQVSNPFLTSAVQFKRTRSWALLAAANYLLVLLAGECFHDHGGTACSTRQASSMALTAEQDNHRSCSASNSSCSAAANGITVGSRPSGCADASGLCLICRFLGQTSAPLIATISPQWVPVAHVDLSPIVRVAIAPATQHLIRGPPVIL